MNLKTEFKNDRILLFLLPSINYKLFVEKNLKTLPGEKICYVTLNKTADALKEDFVKAKIDFKKIIFVDAITKTLKNAPDYTNNVYCINSPGALTELAITIDKLTDKFDYLIFDSITNLLIYQEESPVSRCLSDIINKLRNSGKRAIFYALSVKEQQILIKEVETFVDNVVDFSRKTRN